MLPEELTGPERRLWEAFGTASDVDLRSGDPAADDPTADDPTTDGPAAAGAGWGRERTIRAEVISALLLGAREPEPGRAAGISIIGARITGQLDLDNTEFEHNLRLKGCWFDERVSMYGARTRQLSFSGSRLAGLLASHAQVDSNLRLTGCRSLGEVRLVGARISGALILNQAHLTATDGDALHADRMQVENDLLLRGMTVHGSVSLRSAHIGGSVQLRETRLLGTGGIHAPDHADGLPQASGRTALDAVRIHVGVDLTAYRLHAEGALSLRGADVTGTLFLRAAHLTNPGGRTLDAPGAHIGADIVLDHRFTADGEIRLAGAETPSRVILNGARLTGPDTALSLRHLHARELDLRITTAPPGEIDLRHVALGVLRDDPAAWPTSIRLDGAVYDQLETPLTAAERIPWLDRDATDDTYHPQPYEQLAATYRRLGHEDEARRILLAKQRARRRQLPRPARAWGLLQDSTVGYGYNPARALAWLIGLLVLGVTVFAIAQPPPLEPHKAPDFNPVYYTLDLLLPLVSFGQDSAYAAEGGYQWFAFILTSAGWILATTVAAGAARTLNRQ
ncbi:hypothetical protein [Streptomyces boninensis]|uniref:hypothetical protein n=1 Tax=Streptomyces boninensis TaxID=2039455 RepID=UPI003B220E03